MSKTYEYTSWDRDYAPPKDEEIDPMESDDAMGEYIERRRMEFHEEWFQYLKEEG